MHPDRTIHAPTLTEALKPRKRANQRARSTFETLRTLILLGLFILSVFTQDGVRNFAISGVLLTVALLLQIAHLPNFYRLSMAWTVAYLYIVVSEGYFDGANIARDLGSSRFDEAAQYLNSANAMLLLAHSIVFRESPRRVTQSTGTEVPALVGPIRRARNAHTAVLMFMLVVSAFHVLHMAPYAAQILSSGRVGAGGSARGSDAITPLINGFSSSAGLAGPVMWMYYTLMVRRQHVIYGILAALPIYAVQVAVGTRFVLLISALGATMMYMSQSQLTGASLRRVTGIGIVAFMLASIMRQVRTYGVTGIRDIPWIELLNPGDYEGCVRTMAQLVDYFHFHTHHFGASTASILVFWIPRALWPGKPTLIGYWFPRVYGNARWFSDGHSSSAGFPADAYVDWGFNGGVFTFFIVGMMFGLVEQRVDRMVAERGPASVFACCMFGATFFAVRSPDTAIIVMSGVAAITYLFAISGATDRKAQ